MRIRRRSLLQAGAALVAGAALAKRGFGQAADRQALEKNLDTVLQDAVERGDVPGVVAAVTDRDGTIYEGAFGERGLGQGVPMTIDTVFYLASMTKPITGHRRDAAGRAGQARARRADLPLRAGRREAPGAGGLGRQGRAAPAAAQARDHAAPPR